MNVPGVGDVSMDGPTAAAYEKSGGASALGAPTAMAATVGDGTMLAFTNGTIFSSPSTGAHLVQGEILKAYTAQGGAGGKLGFPTSDEAATGGGYKVTGGGWVSEFQNGTITWTNNGSGAFTETITQK
ncbi:MAG: LGFP repeat-containing protein [Mycobacterium sp.]